MTRSAGLWMTCAVVVAACGGGAAGEPDPLPALGGSTTTSAAVAEPVGESTTTTEAPPEAAAMRPVQLCKDVDRPVPTVIGDFPGGGNPPFEVGDIIAAYNATNHEHFAGVWIDRDYGGTYVLAYTDDPEPRRAELTAMLDAAGFGDALVDVVRARYTLEELNAAAATLRETLQGRDGVAWIGHGTSDPLNRVMVSLDRPTPDQLAVFGTLFPETIDLFCVEGPLWDESMAPPPLDEPLGLLAERDADPLVTCRAGPFPRSLLDQPPDVDLTADDPAIEGLAGSIERARGLIPSDGWRTIERGDESATFARFEQVDGQWFSWIIFLDGTPIGWALAGRSGNGPCDLRIAFPSGVGSMSLGLDPDRALDPTSTSLALVVSQDGCASGRSGVEEMYPVEVIETPTQIEVLVAVRLPIGGQECPGNETAAIMVELADPVGDRTVYDATFLPARPVPVGIGY